MQIDRCYCFQRTFAELKAVAKAQDARSLKALQGHTAFGLRCKLCHPYVRRMLRTGETVFREIVTEREEPDSASGTGGRTR